LPVVTLPVVTLPVVTLPAVALLAVALLAVALLAVALLEAAFGAVSAARSADAVFSGPLLVALLALAGALLAVLAGSAAFAALLGALVGVAFAVAGADFFEAAAVFLAGADLVVAFVAGAVFLADAAEPARPFEDTVLPGAAACAAVFFTATPFLAVAAGAASAAFFVGALAGDRLTTRESVLSNCVATCAGMVLLLALRRPSARSAIALPHMQNRRAAGRRAL
jgi:hypothetical protein